MGGYSMKRKFLSILLTLAMALTLLPVSAMAEGETAEAPAVTKVAKVGDAEYATLAEAVENAKTGDTIVMTAATDISKTGLSIASDKDITLDLNGYEVKAANTGAGNIKVYGKLTLKDSTDTSANGEGQGKITTVTKTYIRNQADQPIIYAVNGDFVMQSGLIDTATGITNNSANGQFGVGVQNETANASVTIEGGKIKAGWYAVAGNGTLLNHDGNITVNGGILESTTDYAIYNPQKGTTTINGGVIYGEAGGISIKRGTLVVNDGTITSKGVGNTGSWGDGTGNLNNAAIQSKARYDTVTVLVKGGKVIAEGDAVTIDTDAEHPATVAVTGGTFSSDISAYCEKNYYTEQNEDDTYTVKSMKNVAVAKTDDTYYKTLAEAVAAADNATVTLLKDVTANVTIPEGKTITLDLNGKTLSGGKNNKKAALLNNGTVTIKDSSATKTGTIKREDDADNTGTSYYVIKNLGTMTIEQANVINNSGYKQTNPSGSMVGSSLICNGDREDDQETTLTINDGVFEQQNFLAVKNGTMGILNVNGGKFTSQHSAIQNWYKADIKGGEINGQLWTDAFTWGENGYSAGVTKIRGATKFTGEIVMDITLYTGITKGKIPTLEISGGEMNVTNWRITSAAANAGAKPVITGGLFTSDPSAYVAADHHVDGSNNGDYPYIVKEGTKTDAPVIVKDATAVTVHDSEAIKGLTESDKTNIANKSNVDGVAEAIADNKAALIPADVDTTGAKKVEIEVTVKVNVTGADMTSENKTLTFEASPVATVTVTKADGSTEVKNDVKVDNSMLNGKPITVTLPLPTVDGKLFTPEQIKHISSDGSVEYFLKTAKRGAKQFTVDGNNCAVFTITKFSTFELSGTVTYVEPSSGGGSSSSSRRYDVSAPSVKHGDVTVSPKTASKGDTVTITVKPDSGYVLETLTVTDKNGNELTLKDKGSGKYTFTMPAGKVEVKATFMEDNSMLNFFYDVPNGAYFYEAVKWAVENGITTGVGNDLFAPEQPCTRAQIVTFLWRAAGSPEPKSTAAGMTDVVPGSYYAKAVAWAVENGITTGTAEGTFSPDATCTRAQAVTFLARAQNAKATGKTAFSDVPADSYFADAVAWAQANGVTTGTSETTFSPDSDCTRAQIVTFLYRANQGT
ncbi:MAG: S-layer homology domain-containing protein [Clostridiales bacterium]|nr:S-layer homology domain-containing protein [Clostridiales bacterium]